jgi:hypothetical protein
MIEPEGSSASDDLESFLIRLLTALVFIHPDLFLMRSLRAQVLKDSFQLSAFSSQLSAFSSQLSAFSSDLPEPISRLPKGSILSPLELAARQQIVALSGMKAGS